MYMAPGPEAALLQYANIDPNMPQQYAPHPQHMVHQPMHNAPYPGQLPGQGAYGAQDSSYMQDIHFNGHARMGSVPLSAVPDMPDDKRRKTSAVTATNDKELREMLSRNEGRPLREVAQEVIQKERTPMAEKTKQLFAMLW